MTDSVHSGDASPARPGHRRDDSSHCHMRSLPLLSHASVSALLLALFNLAPQELPAQEAWGAATDVEAADTTFTELAFDPAVTTGTLPNGLRYYIRENGEPRDRVELRLVVRAGSLQEDDDQLGIAHFLEHMAFNGTQNFEKQALISYMESIGMRFGGDLNASTTYDHTLYRLTIPTNRPDALNTGFAILADWSRGIRLDTEEIEAERGVVLAEWRARLGAGTRVRSRTDSMLLGQSRYLDRNPIGTPERIQNADRETFQRFYRDWYRPELMAVVVVGDVDVEEIEKQLATTFGKLESPRRPRTHERYTIPDNPNTLASVITDPELTGSSVQLVHKYHPAPINSVERMREDIAQSIFASALNQRLRDIASRSDAPFLAASTSFGGYVGGMNAHTVVSVRVRNESVLHGLHASLAEVERIARHGITEEELTREKSSTRSRYTQSMITRSKVTSASYASSYVSHFLSGRTPASIEDQVALARELLETITVEDISEIARRWHSGENMALVALMPESDDVEVPTEAELLAVLDEVRRAELSPDPAERVVVSTRPLLENLPTPGSIVEEKQVPEVGVTEWRLSNGARVLLKPTDFTPDQVLFSGHSWGGTSVLSDAQLLDATLARSLPALSGLGEFSSSQLRNAIVGKILSVGIGINAYSQTVSGRSTVRDLETFLQLVHLHFTSPRLDEEAIASWKHRTKTSLQGRSASPEAHFSDTLTATLSQGHPRNRFLTPARIDSMDAAKALEIYKARFADAGDFTFVMVGEFNPDSIRPLVERYLGGLPSTQGSRGWRDNGVRAPEGVIEKEFRFGREPRGRTSIVFHGEFKHSEDEQFALSAMASVLSTRLREKLREDLGGTYGVGVSPQVRTIPERTYSVQITFDAAPERVDEMRAAVFSEIEKLRNEGPTEDEVAKVREQIARELESSARNNSFWLRVISLYEQMERPLASLEHYGEQMKEVKAADIHEMSRAYLNPSQYIRVTQLPAQ